MERIIQKWEGKKVVYFTEDEIRRTFYYILFGIFLLIPAGSFFLIIKLRKVNRQLEAKVAERTNELSKANKKLREMSLKDGLTNIFNRRYFNKHFIKTWRMSLREKLPLSLILLDIDWFKEFNDTYGHLAGDCCLKNIASILKASIKRSGDFVARFGGEEFIVMFFNTPEEGAMRFAEDIRKKIEHSVIIYEGNKLSITVSLGVAMKIPNEDSNPTELIELADQAMYQAKNVGRNKVIKASLLEDE